MNNLPWLAECRRDSKGVPQTPTARFSFRRAWSAPLRLGVVGAFPPFDRRRQTGQSSAIGWPENASAGLFGQSLAGAPFLDSPERRRGALPAEAGNSSRIDCGHSTRARAAARTTGGPWRGAAPGGSTPGRTKRPATGFESWLTTSGDENGTGEPRSVGREIRQDETGGRKVEIRPEENTSELQSLMRL